MKRAHPHHNRGIPQNINPEELTPHIIDTQTPIHINNEQGIPLPINNEQGIPDNINREEVTPHNIDKEVASHIIDKEVASHIIDKEVASHIIDKEEVTPHIDREEATSHIIDKEGASPHIIDKEEAAPRIIGKEEPTPHIIDREEAPHIIDREEPTPHIIDTQRAIPHDINREEATLDNIEREALDNIDRGEATPHNSDTEEATHDIERGEATPNETILTNNKDSNHLSVAIDSNECALCCQKAKYRCPRCDLVSCSLACSVAHKEQSGCSGKRDRTKFVPLSAFTDATLYSDYNLLSELANHISQQPAKIKALRQYHSYRWQLLQNVASKQKIILELLPPHATRRRKNKSIFDCSRQTIVWSIEWKFGEIELFVENVDETKTIREALHSAIESEDTKSKLTSYFEKEKEIENWQIVMKVEHLPASDSQYFLLDPSATLRESLSQKVIIEFPNFIVVLPEDLKKYKIMTQSQYLITQGSENSLLTELETETDPRIDEEALPDPSLLCDVLQNALLKDGILSNEKGGPLSEHVES